MTFAPVLALNPVEGSQLYEVPPLAVSDTEMPEHIVEVAGETAAEGVLTIVKVKSLQPVANPLAF